MEKKKILQYTAQFLLINLLVWSGVTAFAQETPNNMNSSMNPSEIMVGRSNLVAAADYDDATYEAPAFSPTVNSIIPKYKSPAFIDNISKIVGELLVNLRLVGLGIVITVLLYGYRKAQPALAQFNRESAKLWMYTHLGYMRKYSFMLHRQKKIS